MPRLYTNAKKNKARRMFEEGTTGYRISKDTNIPYPTIKLWVRQWKGESEIIKEDKKTIVDKVRSKLKNSLKK